MLSAAYLWPSRARVCVCVCVCVAQSTKITSLRRINRFVLVMKHAHVFCGVGTELLNTIHKKIQGFWRVPPCRSVKLPTSHRNTVFPSSTMTMEALYSFETLVTTCQYIRRIIIITVMRTSNLASYRLQIVCH